MNFWNLNSVADEVALEQDAERKIGWMLKLFFAGTASYVGYQFFPYLGLWIASLFDDLVYFVSCLTKIVLFYIFLGDNLMQQSVSLLQVKDPLFKRMGASRLARFAIDGNVSICNSLM